MLLQRRDDGRDPPPGSDGPLEAIVGEAPVRLERQGRIEHPRQRDVQGDEGTLVEEDDHRAEDGDRHSLRFELDLHRVEGVLAALGQLGELPLEREDSSLPLSQRATLLERRHEQGLGRGLVLQPRQILGP